VTLGVKAKLFLVSVALIAASLVAAAVYLTPAIEGRLTASIQSGLRDRARLVSRELSRHPTPLSDDLAAWDALADDLGRTSGARVTIIRPDGVVLGDSDVALADVGRMDNHANRPEVQQALTEGEGAAEHMSATLHRPLLYAAEPFRRDDAVAGVVRLAAPLAEIDAAMSEVWRIIWAGFGIALVLAFVLSNVLASRMSSAVGELTDAARRMTEGDLEVRTRLAGHDELGGLGQALDRLAGSLATTLGELRAERDLQGRILEAMHEGVVVVDREGRIVLMNPALRSQLLLGADAIGKLLIETVRHAQLDTVVDHAREAPDDLPVEIELPGLKPRRLLVQAAPLSGDDEGLLLVFVDVTELRRLESLRRDFVANASHELRTPIAAVRSATETLQTGALEDPVAANRFLDIIERNAQRLQSLVEDMLELSKLESNEFKLKRERVELQRIVPIVLALFRERAEKKGVRLAADLGFGLPAVEGDPRALEHVLSNLVDNAVKYCPSGARIVVSAAADDARVRLVVADTGPGIPAEHLPRVFERFYRVDAGRSRELGGTGLGLSIVKHMVETMRGKVAVESAVGKGSTFIVSLQRVDGVASATQSEPS
jgi:two-component system, OmpR family, phosphate regulon sensor histidine kinase PhoR